MLSLKSAVSLMAIIVSIHLILLLNKTYAIGDTVFDSKEQYHLYIASTPAEVRSFYVSDTKIRYFSALPEWIVNYFYVLEMLLVVVIVNRPVKKPEKVTDTTKERPVKKPGETGSEYVRRVVAWNEEQEKKQLAIDKIQDMMLRVRVALSSKKEKL